MNWLCHNLNSLHVFCRLLDLGMSRERALRVARCWEVVVHPGIYCSCKSKVFI